MKTGDVDRIPKRVISLAPGCTEIMFALGREGTLVGVTTSCDYPEAAKNKPKIGDYSLIDIEKMVALEPDLILATKHHKAEVLPKLESLGLNVLLLDPKSLDEVMESIVIIGKRTGAVKAAGILVSRMKNRMKAVTDKIAGLSQAQKPRVFYIDWLDPLRTIGSDCHVHALIVAAGGINISQNLTGIAPFVSLEAVTAANPQVIIAGPCKPELSDEIAFIEPKLSSVDAGKNNRKYRVNVSLVGRPGPRIMDGLEQIAKMIHPEIFGLPR